MRLINHHPSSFFFNRINTLLSLYEYAKERGWVMIVIQLEPFGVFFFNDRKDLNYDSLQKED